MPIGPQPPGARGTVGHPYSALNLRLALASFGLVSCVGFAVLLAWLGHRPAAVVVGLLGLVALIDIVVIQRRRRQRRRLDGGHHSLFE